MHVADGPVIADGSGFTVTFLVIEQPLLAAVNFIVSMPGDTPVTIPEIDPTVAIAELLLQVPGLLISVKGVVPD